MHNARKSFAIFAAATVLSVVGAVSVNAYADPYDVFGRLPAAIGPANLRINAALELRSKQPQFMFLGSSRADAFAEPVQALIASSSTISLHGTTIYEERRFFEHALAVAPIKRVALLLDFLTFNIYQAPTTMESVLAIAPDGSSTNALAGYLPALVSLDALKASIDVLRTPPGGPGMPEGALAPTRARYESVLCYMMRPGGIFRPNPLQRFDIRDGKAGRTTLAEYERILELAHGHDIELTLMIAPTHASLIQGVEAFGQWQMLEAWKRELVSVNERVAARAGRKPFALWTFEDVTTVTTEDVPPGFNGQLGYFPEPSHFGPHVARFMLERAYAMNEAEVPEDFGELLTPATIERSLAGTRERLAAWRDSHPEVVELVAKSVRGDCTF
jgi:hypothetical protein